MAISSKKLDGYLAAVLGVCSLILGCYAFGYPNDVEDFNSTAVSTSLFMKSLSDGANPFWTSMLGIGMPQPFRISLIQHPLGFLFALLPATLAYKAAVFIHGLVSVLFMYLLARKLEMPRLVAATCTLTFVFCTTTIEFLFLDDFFSAWLSFCFYPIIAYMFVILLEERHEGTALAIGAAMGLAAGLMIATGLLSHISSYVLTLSIFVALPPDAFKRHWKPLAVGGLIALLASSGVLTMLASEFVLFPSYGDRIKHINADVSRHLASAFMVDYWRVLLRSPSELFPVILADDHRVVGFGPVAALIVLASFFFDVGSHGVRVKLTIFMLVLFLSLPVGVYFGVITATWVFRDGINFFGILLFGLGVSRLASSKFAGRKRLVVGVCIAQIAILAVVALPLISRTVQIALRPDSFPDTRAALNQATNHFFADLAPFVAKASGRIALAPDFANLLALNVLALNGVPVVNAYARGIATGALHPDRGLMEGSVGVTRQNVTDPAWLRTLGVEYVLGIGDELVASNLRKLGEVKLLGRSVTVWHNSEFWLGAREVTEDARNFRLVRKSCEHDRFLCADFAPVARTMTETPAPYFSQRAGTMTLAFYPSSDRRLFLFNSWYRPAWTALDDRVKVVPLFDQFLGIEVPPGVQHVSLTYLPWTVLTGYFTSSTAIALTALFLCCSFLRRLGARFATNVWKS